MSRNAPVSCRDLSRGSTCLNEKHKYLFQVFAPGFGSSLQNFSEFTAKIFLFRKSGVPTHHSFYYQVRYGGLDMGSTSQQKQLVAYD